MEWERKFYDIIQETESNLARARRKLHGRCSPRDTNNSLDILGSVPLSLSSVQPKGVTRWEPGVSSGLSRSRPLTSSHLLPAGSGLSASVHASPATEMGQLLSKIDSQNLMIDRLERLVRTLNQEKDQYRRHITDLQSEVGGINSKLNETRYMNPHLETQVDLMRHEVRSDIHHLQNMISAARNSSLHSQGLESSFKDMQYSVHAELEGIRRDLNLMAHRVGRLELDMSSHSVSQRDLHNRMNSGLMASSFSSQCGQTSHLPVRQSLLDGSPVKDLRCTVSQLHEKLDSLEGQLAASSVHRHQQQQQQQQQQASPLLRGLQKLYKPKTTLKYRNYGVDDDDDDDDSEISDLDDLDLSDLDLSSDDDDQDLSEEVEMIIQRASAERSSGRRGQGKVTLADLDLSSDDPATLSSEGADISDLDLDNLDLSSAEGSLDLSPREGGSTGLKMDDL